MLHRLFLLSTAVVCLLMTGCLWLPIPNRSTEEYGVKARVVDADTGRPIFAAIVCDKYNVLDRTVTDRFGEFQMAPRFQWHAGYQFGALNFPIWPFTSDVVPQSRYLTVRATGYQRQSLELEDASGQPNISIQHHYDAVLMNGAWVGEGYFEKIDAKLHGDWLETSRIPLHRIRTPQDEPATATPN